jgi:hypothetical protein|eukprot:COSAG02_NODE_13712_length_1358_cov_1.295473_2_plen_143_part_00
MTAGETQRQAKKMGCVLFLLQNTRFSDADATGLLNCSAQVANGCSTRPGGGHHIVDWDPAPSGSMFRFSQHLSVNNAFCLRGLLDLAEVAGLLNQTAAASQYASEAAALRKAMETLMWNASAGMFCDGACVDTVSDYHGCRP